MPARTVTTKKLVTTLYLPLRREVLLNASSKTSRVISGKCSRSWKFSRYDHIMAKSGYSAALPVFFVGEERVSSSPSTSLLALDAILTICLLVPVSFSDKTAEFFSLSKKLARERNPVTSAQLSLALHLTNSKVLAELWTPPIEMWKAVIAVIVVLVGVALNLYYNQPIPDGMPAQVEHVLRMSCAILKCCRMLVGHTCTTESILILKLINYFWGLSIF